MKVFKATAGEWQSGLTHYLIAAESIEQAYVIAQEASMSYIDFDDVWRLDSVFTDITVPGILEEF